MVDFRISKTGYDSVTLPAARMERIITKALVKVQRGVPRHLWETREPTTKIYDYLKILDVFRIRGKFVGANWAAVKTYMDNCILIFEAGGNFTFTWHDTDYAVNLQQCKFEELGPKTHVLEYTIDLMKGEET